MPRPRAIIVGSGGQDGRILADVLTARGYELLAVRRGLDSVDILNSKDVSETVKAFAPEQIYYLAAFHHSAEDQGVTSDEEIARRSHDVHVTGLRHFLDAMGHHARSARLFYAASSHLFGRPGVEIQDESTPFDPRGAYAVSKAAGVQLCREYRTAQKLFAAVGILYNHESPLRRADFLSQKIVRAAVAITQGRQEKLVLGDPSARVDWSDARDVVEAMIRVLALPQPDDFIVASGQAHSVADFAAIAFREAGLDDWRKYVEVDSTVLSKGRVTLIGDSSKLRRATGWQPAIAFEQMITALVRAEQQRTATL